MIISSHPSRNASARCFAAGRCCVVRANCQAPRVRKAVQQPLSGGYSPLVGLEQPHRSCSRPGGEVSSRCREPPRHRIIVDRPEGQCRAVGSPTARLASCARSSGASGRVVWEPGRPQRGSRCWLPGRASAPPTYCGSRVGRVPGAAPHATLQRLREWPSCLPRPRKKTAAKTHGRVMDRTRCLCVCAVSVRGLLRGKGRGKKPSATG